jgi:uncharacterized membrane protein YedE/YeeE
MRERLIGFASGTLFAIGLALSGMTDPGKVLAFLDVAGAWDPTLAFVMGGAVGFHGLWLLLSRRSRRTATSPKAEHGVDARLVGGAALFGVGWGLSGYCPGPALVAIGMGRHEAVVFVAAMAAGVLLHSLRQSRGNVELAAADEA